MLKLIIILILILLTIAIPLYIKEKKEIEIEESILNLADSKIEVTPAKFFEMRQVNPANFNFTGVYILHNKTKNMYYVGQGKSVLDRINNHFTGSGNGDVYADYKYGDEWTIKAIALNGSNYYSINELERITIDVYDSFENGYNKTRGNI